MEELIYLTVEMIRSIWWVGIVFAAVALTVLFGGKK